jgi:predicted nicotinamide N-methyase
MEELGGQKFELFRLHNLDQTIDALFESLKSGGEESLLEELCPYFGKVWPSARGLCEFLKTQSLVKRSVLEIGCGLALPSIFAAKKGASVFATDFHPDVPWFLKKNIDLNLTPPEKGRFRYGSFDWRALGAMNSSWDWIMGSDILYERAHFQEVARALDELATPATQVLVADPGRPYLQSFSDEMIRLGWKMKTHVFRVNDPPDDSLKAGENSSPTVKDVFVLHFV